MRRSIVFAATVAILGMIVLGAMFGHGAALISQKSDLAFWSGVLLITIVVLLAIGLGFYIETLIRAMVRHYIEEKFKHIQSETQKSNKEFVDFQPETKTGIPPKQETHGPTSRLTIVGVFLLVALLSACTNVPPGHVGIKVNNWGSAKGVEDFPLVTGVVIYNPITSSIFDWPTSVQTAIWTRSPTEGSKNNEEISYNSAEGLAFTADISLSYRLLPERVPHFYVQFRSDNMQSFTHGFLRNVARDAFNEVAAHYPSDELYGIKKEEVLVKARERINAATKDIGVIIEQFGYVGAPRPPQNVVEAINMKIKATQDAIRTENEVRSAKAEAQKAVAKAQGEAQSIVARSEGEAKANLVLQQSLTPQLLEWRRLTLTEQAIAKWDGKRPQVEGSGSGLLLNITPGK